jgi:hypothetical protein
VTLAILTNLLSKLNGIRPAKVLGRRNPMLLWVKWLDAGGYSRSDSSYFFCEFIPSLLFEGQNLRLINNSCFYKQA